MSQVAYHIIGKDLKKLSSVVEALIMHVIDQVRLCCLSSGMPLILHV